MDLLKGHIIRGKYAVVKALGQGSSAKVYECEDMETRKRYAVKVVNKAYQSEESSIMQKLSHPNIPKLTDFHEEGHLRYMIMEMGKGQTLQSHLEKGEKFKESEAAMAMQNIMKALEHCHKNGVVHGDLKPDNLVYQHASKNSPLMLVDFGLAKEFPPGETRIDSDIKSAAQIMISMLCGHKRDKDTEVRSGQIKSEKILTECRMSKDARDLLKMMLDSAPPTAEKVLEHTWMKKTDHGSTTCDIM